MLSFFGFLFGCKPKETVVYEDVCNGEPLQFSVKEKAHYATIKFWMELKVGKLKAIKITPDDVYDQTPYSLDLLNGFPHYLYDTSRKQTKFGEIEVDRKRMFIFISPHTYSKQDFETIHSCLSQRYANIETALYDKFINTTTRVHFNHPQFAGLLYADITDFNIVYTSADNSNTITFPFNGNVLLQEKGGGVNAKSILGSIIAKKEAHFLEYKPTLNLLDFTNKETGRYITEDFSLYTDKNNLVFWVKK